MPKKKTEHKVKPVAIVKKLLLLPSDWVEQIDATRGSTTFAEFVRAAIKDRLACPTLSEMPGWGKGRLKK